MKEYRLAAWPELDALHNRIAYRRLLSDISQRYVALPDLASRRGLSRHEVTRFLEQLAARGLVTQRESTRPDRPAPRLHPLRHWLRRALGENHTG